MLYTFLEYFSILCLFVLHICAKLSLYSDTNFRSEVTLYAIWQAHSYNISYNLDGGTISENSSTGTFDQVVNIPYPTKDGYVFAGWTITGYELNTAQTGTSEDNLATLTEAVAETVGTKNRYFKNLTSLDINEVADEKDATITFSAQWVEVPSNAYAKDIITPAMYGDKVNYNANGVSDWKIFLNDKGEDDSENHIYLIAENCVLNRMVTVNDDVFVGGDDYAVVGKSRSKLINWLTTTSNWSAFASGINVNGELATATGGPTLPQWIKSWNAKGYQTLYYTKGGQMSDGLEGYYLGVSMNPTSGSANLASYAGVNDTLYFKNRDNLRYWLASASSDNGEETDMLIVNYSGGIWKGGHGYDRYGTRPLIKLPTNLKMTWNSTNNAWDIAPTQLTGEITAQNYGDKVDYNDPAGVNDWKLFLDEDGTKYLISSRNVPISTLNLGESGKIIVEGMAIISAENDSEILLEWLLNEEYWENFREQTFAQHAIGGCNLDQLIKSSNGKLGNGYDTGSIVGKALMDDLYMTGGTWIAERYVNYEPYVTYLDWQGKVFGCEPISPYCGIRPLVTLNSTTKLTKWDGEKWHLSSTN